MTEKIRAGYRLSAMRLMNQLVEASAVTAWEISAQKATIVEVVLGLNVEIIKNRNTRTS